MKSNTTEVRSQPPEVSGRRSVKARAVVAGLVQSMARPAGNVTGFTPLSIELTSKRLELLTAEYNIDACEN